MQQKGTTMDRLTSLPLTTFARPRRHLAAGLAALALAAFCGVGAAQPLTLEWNSLDGGSFSSTPPMSDGVDLTVYATIGQPDVGTLTGTDGINTLLLDGGFWPATFNTPCLADVASDGLDLYRNPNGAVGPEDLDAFIAAFIAENAAVADLATDGLDTFYNPNGSVGSEDLDAFIAAFIAGC